MKNPSEPPTHRCPRCGKELPLGAASGVCPACAFDEAQAAPPTNEGADTLSLDDIPPPGKPQVAPEKSDTIKLGSADFRHRPIRNKPGDRIGRYKLLEEIGEGGCGVVYVAEQEQPVRRRVALKVIKLGMDTREVIARFEAERQALAMMDHPNIAKVLDAGATETGRPYFVMELVKGVRITDYCDRNNLATTERLSLFIQVCHAIQHAHQKGIIHRDIKPSNILVTLHDGVPVPKVIDFGIAKSTTNLRLTDKTVYTAIEQFIGTPAYMSPEQAELSGLDIDTRSDIYALGVLLYELLTGQTPFDAKRLIAAGLDEIRRIIREEEPPRPSTRISTLTDVEQTAIAKRRHSEPLKLLGIVRGDLDWIVMKTLEKDRTRRYESSSGLAADLQRYLSNEPVVARPPSQFYRFQKLVRRNKLVFAAAAAVVAALLLGLAASTWWAIQANRARRAEVRQRQQADLARQQAEAAERVAADERARAETKEQAARLTMSATDFRLATHLVDEDRSSEALAYLARSLKGNRTNAAAATRLCSLLTYHPWALPVARITCTNWFSEAHFSPDAKRVVTLSAGSLQIWNALTGEPLIGPLQETQKIQSVVFSPDGTQMATLSGEVGSPKDLQVRDASTGTLQWGPLGQDRKAYSAYFSPDGEYVLTVSFRNVWVWDAKTGSLVAGPLPDLADCSPVFSRDGRRLLTASPREDTDPLDPEFETHVWDIRTGQRLAGPMVHPGTIRSAQFNSNGTQIVTALRCNREPWQGNHVRVWDATSGQLLAGPMTATNFYGELSADGQALLITSSNAVGVLRVPTGEVVTHPLREPTAAPVVRFSRDGKRFLTNCRRDNTVQVWDTYTGDPLTEPMKHVQEVWLQEFSSDGNWVLTVAGDTLTVWDARHAPALGQLLRHKGAVNSARFSPDGERVVTASEDGTARVWDAHTSQPLTPALAQPKYSVRSAKFDYGGKRVITLSGGTAQIWDARTGRALGKPMKHATAVLAGEFSPDGNRVVTTVALGGPARLWDAKTGEPLGELLKNKGFDHEAEFSPDGARILTTGWGTRVWDSQSRELLLEVVRDAEVRAAHFSPDGQRILTATEGDNSVDKSVVLGVVQVWDAKTGGRLIKPINHAAHIPSVRFSPDGQRIAMASFNNTARVWDAHTGESVSEPMKHGAEVYSAQFSPDGQRIVTASRDGTARVWDAETGRPLTDPMQCAKAVVSAEFSPDGQRMVTASGDGTARMWDIAPSPELSPDWLLDLAEAVSGQTLNRQGLLVPTDGVEILKQIREKLSPQPGNNPWVLWGRWFLAEPDTRTISPFSKVSAGEGTELGLRENTHSPNDTAQTLNRLAWLYATSSRVELRDSACAMTFAEKAAALTDRNDDAILDTLAAAYAEAGRFTDAVRVQHEALAVMADEKNKSDYDARLKLYEQRSPYHETSTNYLATGTGDPLQMAALFRERGTLSAQLAQWTLAFRDLTNAVALNPDEHWTWYQLAPLLLRNGDVAGFGKHCHAMLARFGTTNDPPIAERTAKASLLIPSMGEDLAAASRLADLAVTAGTNNSWLAYFQTTKGLAEYREKQFTNAVFWEKKALEQAGQVDDRDVQAWCVLAMAHQKLGQAGEALAALAKAKETTAAKLPELDSGNLGSSWHDVLFANFLLREAKELVEGGATGEKKP